MAGDRGGRNQLREIGRLSSFGIELALSLLVPVYIGYRIDRAYGTRWAAISGFALGIVVAARAVLRLARVGNKDRDPPSRTPPSRGAGDT